MLVKLELLFLAIFINLVFSHECYQNDIPVDIIRRYGRISADETYTIYKGVTTEHVVHRENGYGKANKMIFETICLQDSLYTLELRDAGNNGWSSGSTIELKVAGDLSILKVSLFNHNYETYTFYPHISIPLGSPWRYNIIAQETNDWKMPDYEEAQDWNTISNGQTLPTTAITTYYRKTVTYKYPLNNFALFEVGVFTRGAFIISVDGNEVFRWGIKNDVALTPLTWANRYNDKHVWFNITFPPTYLSFPKSVISIEVHTVPQFESKEDTFNAYMLLYYGPCSIRYTGSIQEIEKKKKRRKDMVLKSKLEDPNLLTNFNGFDEYIYKGSDVELKYVFDDNRYEYINTYSLMSSHSSPRADPATWVLTGAVNNFEAYQLDYRDQFIFKGRSQFTNIYLYTSIQHYRYYTFKLLNNNGERLTKMSEFQLKTCNYVPVVTSLQYPQVKYNYIKEVSFVYIYPLSTGYEEFQLTPLDLLPPGLTFNQLNGTITGYSHMILKPTLFTVEAKNSLTQDMEEFSFRLTIESCSYPYIYVSFYTYYSSESSHDRWVFKDYRGNRLLSNIGVDILGTVYTDISDICVEPDNYYINLHTDNKHGGWSQGSYIQIFTSNYANSKDLVFRGKLTSGYKQRVPLNLLYIVPSLTVVLTDEYQQNPDTNQVLSKNWYYIAFNETKQYPPKFDQDFYHLTNDWVSLLPPPMTPVSPSIPNNNRIVFIQGEFYMANLDRYDEIYINICSRGGFIVYLNGKSLFNHNLNYADILTNRYMNLKSVIDTDVTCFQYFGDIHTVQAGWNRIVIQNVVVTSSAAYNKFMNSKARLNDQKENILKYYFDITIRGLISSHFNQLYDAEMKALSRAKKTGESISSLIDNSYDTQYVSTEIFAYTKDKTIALSFTNKLSYINKFCLVSNINKPHGDPSTFSFYYKVEANGNWIKLSSSTNVHFERRKERRCLYLPPNHPSASHYKLDIEGAAMNDDYIALSEMELYAVPMPKEIQLSVQPKAIHLFQYNEFPKLTIQSDYLYDFTITPKLPTGLTLDSTTGSIRGFTSVIQKDVQYTLSATGVDGQTYSDTITISNSVCEYPNHDIVIHLNSKTPIKANDPQLEIYNYYDHTRLYHMDLSFRSLRETIHRCFATGIYELIFSDQNNYGWEGFTYKIIHDGSVLEEGTINQGDTPHVISINLAYLLKDNSQWLIAKTYDNLPEDWKNSIVEESDTWEPYVASTYSYSEIHPFFLRNTFTIEDAEIYSMLQFVVTVPIHSGLLIYVNGELLTSYHLTTKEVDEKTVYTVHHNHDDNGEKTRHVYTTGSGISGVEEGLNHIAVVIYWENTLQSFKMIKDHFDLYIQGFPGHSERLEQAIPWGRYMYIQNVVDTDDVGEKVQRQYSEYRAIDDKLMAMLDDHDSDHVVETDHCVDSEIGWRYENQRKEFINHYSIGGNIKCRSYNPTAWQLYGSNVELNTHIDEELHAINMNDYSYDHVVNDQGWKLLDEQTEITWKVGELTKAFDINNVNSYNIYKLVIKQCDSTVVETDKTCKAGHFGISAFELFVVRPEMDCAAIPPYSSAKSGTFSVLPCKPGYFGEKRRFCRQGLFEEEEDLCMPQPPKFFTYNVTRHVLQVNVTMTPIAPFYEAIDQVFSISPKLPDGLSFNATSGIITGTPMVVYPMTSYTVTLMTKSGALSAHLNIETFIPSCAEEGEWKSVYVNQYSYKPCVNFEVYQGNYRRLCRNTSPPTWDSVEDFCTYRLPSDIHYSQSEYDFFANTEIPSLTLSYKGYIESATISPSLPPGLYFDTSIFTIDGKPETLSSKTVYNITFTNPTGSVSIPLTIRVKPEPCHASGEWPLTEIGQEASLPCLEPAYYEGRRHRYCNAGNPPMFLAVVDDCILLPPHNFSYPMSTMKLIENKYYEIAPYIAGKVESFVANPSLKGGLDFNLTSGVIFGTVTESFTSTTFFITASNSVADVQARITLETTTVYCPKEGSWPDTLPGEYAEIPCEDPTIYSGFRKRRCKNGSVPRWGPESNYCALKAPSNLAYNIPAVLYLDSPYTFYPTYSGRVTQFFTKSQLPLGLSLDSKSGIISGTVMATNEGTTITVKALNTKGSTEVTFDVSVSSFYCYPENSWPRASAGTVITLECPDMQNYKGTMTRKCIEPNTTFAGGWGPIVNKCRMLAPRAMSFDETAYVLKSYVEMDPLIPYLDGMLTYVYTVPELVEGLTISNTTGIISGTPLVKSGKYTYLVVGGNESGEVKTKITLSFSRQMCVSDGEWPSSDADTFITINCPNTNYYQGYKKRECKSSHNITGIYGAVEDRCSLRYPSNIHFDGDHIVLYKGQTVNKLKPSYNGLVTSCTITPSLPKGLVFNEELCYISGTPVGVSSLAAYTMVLSNPVRQSYYVFTLEVVLSSCPYQYPWPETEVNSKVYIFCPENEGGVMSRQCVYDKELKSNIWTNEDRSRCISSYDYIAPKVGYNLVTFSVMFNNVPKGKFTPEVEEITRITLAESLLLYGVDYKNVYVRNVEIIEDDEVTGIETVIMDEDSSEGVPAEEKDATESISSESISTEEKDATESISNDNTTEEKDTTESISNESTSIEEKDTTENISNESTSIEEKDATESISNDNTSTEVSETRKTSAIDNSEDAFTNDHENDKKSTESENDDDDDDDNDLGKVARRLEEEADSSVAYVSSNASPKATKTKKSTPIPTQNIMVTYLVMIEKEHTEDLKTGIKWILSRQDFGNIIKKKEPSLSTVTLFGSDHSISVTSRRMSYTLKIYLITIISVTILLAIGLYIILTNKVPIIEEFINQIVDRYTSPYESIKTYEDDKGTL